jgi:hypothetical protein
MRAFVRTPELALVVMLCGAVYGDLSRFKGPVLERYVPNIVQPGGIDFAHPYLATVVFLRGENPYHHDIADLKIGGDVFSGRHYDFVYGPAHLLLFAPLVHLTDGNRHLGNRVWFHLNLLWCALLAAVVVAIANRLRAPEKIPLATAALVAATLALSPSQNMLLERGQTDLFISLLCWSAVLFALRNAWGLAVGACLVSVLMKPYAVPLLFGLILFAEIEGGLRRALIGLVVAGVCLLPVWRFVPVSLQAALDRSGNFAEHWTSSSFLRLFRNLDVPEPELAKWTVLAFGAFACAALLWRCLKESRLGAGGPSSDRQRSLIYFACASLAFSLGASDASAFYNLVLVIPGLLALVLIEQPSSEPSWSARLARGLMLLACATLFWLLPQQGDRISLPAVGFILIFAATFLRARRLAVAPRHA